MLLHSTVTALAGWFGVSTGGVLPPAECSETWCQAECEEYTPHTRYWCCANWQVSCPTHRGALMQCDPWDTPLGYCYSYP